MMNATKFMELILLESYLACTPPATLIKKKKKILIY